MKQILVNLKGEFDSNIIIIVDFNTALSIMGRTLSHKIDKEVDLNSAINQMDLTDKYRTTCPPTME